MIIGNSAFAAGTIDTSKTGSSVDFTADIGYTYQIAMGTGAPSDNLIITLPTSSVVRGDAIRFIVTTANATYGVSIAGKVEGLTMADGGPLMLMNVGDSLTLRYIDATVGWTVVDGNVKLSSMDFKTITATTYDASTFKTDVLLGDCTSNGITITLPPVATTHVKRFLIKKTDSTANKVTIDGNSSETIDGATTQLLSNQYDWMEVVTDGSEWFIASQSATAASEDIQSITATPVSAKSPGSWTSTVYLVDSTGGAVDVPLPPAAEWTSKRITVKWETGASAVTFTPNGAELLEGANSSVTVTSALSSATVTSDGTECWIVSGYKM